MQFSGYRFIPLFLLWFGAAVSVAEMEAGGLTIGAGVPDGLWAIAGGHAVGALLLGLLGFVGFREKTPAIMCTRISFGIKGSWLLSLANALQLFGWTAVMLRFAGQAANGIAGTLWRLDYNVTGPAIVVVACLVALWSFWETQGSRWGNMAAVTLLGCLAALMTWLLWEHTGGALPPPPAGTAPMNLGVACDLSLVMPLSWAPLVADYSCRARNARIAFWGPCLGYGISSVWMYGLGFAGTLVTGAAGPIALMQALGLGMAALLIVALSTVCTTFLDVYSAVMSARNIAPNLPEKAGVFVVATVGAVAAFFIDTAAYQQFLLLIGAVFAPMVSILLGDALIFHTDSREKSLDCAGMFSLVAGIAAHTVFARWGVASPVLACLAFTFVLHGTVRWVQRKYGR